MKIKKLQRRRIFCWPYKKGYSLLEWILLNLDMCPKCKIGKSPHRNCFLR
jgi:hypothetical protein